MLIPFKKTIFLACYNISLFLLLMIGIQNSSNQTKVNFISSQTIRLPVSFIIGLSFIGGSITGSFINLSSLRKKDNNL